jgi:serine protease AprX
MLSVKAGLNMYQMHQTANTLVIVQFKHLLEPEEHAELDRRKIHLQQYTGANTYICYYDPSDLSSIRDLDFVEYANVYHPDLVIHDVLKAKCDL